MTKGEGDLVSELSGGEAIANVAEVRVASEPLEGLHGRQVGSLRGEPERGSADLGRTEQDDQWGEQVAPKGCQRRTVQQSREGRELHLP